VKPMKACVRRGVKDGSFVWLTCGRHHLVVQGQTARREGRPAVKCMKVHKVLRGVTDAPADDLMQIRIRNTHQ